MKTTFPRTSIQYKIWICKSFISHITSITFPSPSLFPSTSSSWTMYVTITYIYINTLQHHRHIDSPGFHHRSRLQHKHDVYAPIILSNARGIIQPALLIIIIRCLTKSLNIQFGIHLNPHMITSWLSELMGQCYVPSPVLYLCTSHSSDINTTIWNPVLVSVLHYLYNCRV